MGRWRNRGLCRRLRSSDRAVVAECPRVTGLSGLARTPLSRLSGGQRQRALVAQGLACRAGVLLVDEPTANVDEHTREALVMALAAEAARGAVVVHATHDAAAVERADHVVTLVAGRVAPPAQAGAQPVG